MTMMFDTVKRRLIAFWGGIILVAYIAAPALNLTNNIVYNFVKGTLFGNFTVIQVLAILYIVALSWVMRKGV